MERKQLWPPGGFSIGGLDRHTDRETDKQTGKDTDILYCKKIIGSQFSLWQGDNYSCWLIADGQALQRSSFLLHPLLNSSGIAPLSNLSDISTKHQTS